MYSDYLAEIRSREIVQERLAAAARAALVRQAQEGAKPRKSLLETLLALWQHWRQPRTAATPGRSRRSTCRRPRRSLSRGRTFQAGRRCSATGRSRARPKAGLYN